MSFQVRAIDHAAIAEWLALDETDLTARDARWMTADAKPGYPCRVSLADAEVGERVLLFPHTHHDVASPYRGEGPIFVREGATTAAPGPDEVPLMLRHRLLSFRGYDEAGMMRAAETAEGADFERVVGAMFESEDVAYIHVHNAGPGCYNCSVSRA